jgi:DNA-binding MarR family transcriptional regulator
MGRFDSQKVSLPGALRLLAELEPLRRRLLVGELAHRFGCSGRAAEDALTVLWRGGYVERTGSTVDGRGRDYRVSERGHALLAHPGHPGLLRLARRLLTACPSEKVRRLQLRQGSLAERQQKLARQERLLLQEPIREPTLPERVASFALALSHAGRGFSLESALDLAIEILPLLEQLPDAG